MPIACSPRLEVMAVPGIPLLNAGDDLAALTVRALGATRPRIDLLDGDVVVVASKAVSRAEGRFVDLATVEATPAARALARDTAKDERFVELVLRESTGVSRAARDILVVRHRLGFVCANAGIDQSNARPDGAPQGSGPWVLLLPEAPDASAAALRRALGEATGSTLGVIVSDSFGRPFRLGSVGVAVGVAGLPSLWDKRGEVDLCGRQLEHTVTGLADQVAAAADLVAGQGAEGRAVAIVRGLTFEPGGGTAADLSRPADRDVYA